jgi:gas vesicle protein
MSEVKEKIEQTVETVKETAKEVKEKVEDTAKEVKTTVKEVAEKGKNVIETTKAKSWWNRIWSAIVGAVLAVAAMFGITNDKVAQEKALMTQVKQYTEDALVDIKAGNIKAAAEKLEQAKSIGKTVVTDVKETVENVKNANKEDVKNVAIEGAKEGFKNSKEVPVKEETTPEKK